MNLKSVETDCHLFSKLYMGCQSPDGDLDDFLSLENQGSPPSLSDCGRIRSGSECDLIQCPSVTPVGYCIRQCILRSDAQATIL